MDWENENWVKLYTRDTGEMVSIGWEARALFREMLCKCDRAGIVAAATDEDLAALVRMPSHVVTACHTVLRERGIVSRTDQGVLINNFLDAQEARTSDKERQRRSRARRRDVAKLGDFDVTSCHTVSHGVTNRVEESREEKSNTLAHRPDERERFDFEPLYQRFPKKVGKARGLKLCKSKVKSQSKFDQLAKAVDEMARLWSKASREQLKFCPQFDTWMSKDRWLDAEQVGPGEDERPQSHFPQLEAL